MNFQDRTLSDNLATFYVIYKPNITVKRNIEMRPRLVCTVLLQLKSILFGMEVNGITDSLENAYLVMALEKISNQTPLDTDAIIYLFRREVQNIELVEQQDVRADIKRAILFAKEMSVLFGALNKSAEPKLRVVA